MPVIKQEVDRRRAPRFNCGGLAAISRLPWDGSVVSGKLRNLSAGGICVDTTHPIEHGDRTEVLVCVNAVSFRALGQVRALCEGSRASMEFVQMSAGGKSMLAELLDQLAKLQLVMKNLRTQRAATAAQLLRELEEAGVRAPLFGERISSMRGTTAGAASGVGDEPGERDSGAKAGPLVIQVDLFG